MKNFRIQLFLPFVIVTSLCQSQWIRNYNISNAMLDAGAVSLQVNNLGNLETGYGGFWNASEGITTQIVFDHGLNIIGKVNDTVRVLMNYWWSPFSPGPIIDGVPAVYSSAGDTSRYGLYKISKGDSLDSNPDLLAWPHDLGAPVDSVGRPELYGDQTIWMIYNGADMSSRRGGSLTKDSLFTTLPVEVHQTVYSYKKNSFSDLSFVDDVVFMEWKIINKGNISIDSAYLGLWTDIDFNYGTDNLPAVDTIAQLGYCWSPRDTMYFISGRAPKSIAIGYSLLYGPNVPSPGNTAIFGERSLPNRKNLPMTSFWGISDDSYSDSSDLGPPYSLGTAWNVARGFDQRGKLKIDSTTGKSTRFSYPGDPVTGSGWIFPRTYTGGGAGFLFYSGPLTIAAGDTQWMMIALLPSIAPNHFQSIEQLRMRSSLLHELSVDEIRGKGFEWESHFNTPGEIPSYHRLYQNYPNPFNPTTTILYDIAVESNVEISIYNVIGQKIATVVNERKPIGKYSVDFRSDDLASGVYFCRMKVDYMTLERKMIILR